MSEADRYNQEKKAANIGKWSPKVRTELISLAPSDFSTVGVFDRRHADFPLFRAHLTPPICAVAGGYGA
jgi:hypothetical protein